jgi:hypothetical protein
MGILAVSNLIAIVADWTLRIRQRPEMTCSIRAELPIVS